MPISLAIPALLLALVVGIATVVAANEKGAPTRRGDRWLIAYVIAFPAWLIVQAIAYGARHDWVMTIEAVIIYAIVLPMLGRALVTRQRRWNRYRDNHGG